MKVKMSVLILLFCCLLVSNAYSQVNTESLRKDYTKDGIFINFASSIGLSYGNTDFIQIKGDVRTDYVFGDFYSFLSGSAEFKKSETGRIVNKAFSHLRFNYPLTENITAELFLQKEFDEFILIDDRNLLGTGLRLHLMNIESKIDSNTHLNIYFGSGAMYEHEEFKSKITPRTEMIRSTNYLSLKWDYTKYFSFISIFYYQVDFTRLNDFKLLNETTLKFYLAEPFAFFTNFSYRFNNVPIDNLKKYDLEIKNGIAFKF